MIQIFHVFPKVGQVSAGFGFLRWKRFWREREQGVVENLRSFFLTLVAKCHYMLLIFVSVVCQGWIKKLLVYSQLLMLFRNFGILFLPRRGQLKICDSRGSERNNRFLGEKIGWLLDVNYGTVTGKGCVCVFKFFFILLFCCYKSFLKFIF